LRAFEHILPRPRRHTILRLSIAGARDQIALFSRGDASRPPRVGGDVPQVGGGERADKSTLRTKELCIWCREEMTNDRGKFLSVIYCGVEEVSDARDWGCCSPCPLKSSCLDVFLAGGQRNRRCRSL
jgi:hypothetical protein